MHKGLDFLAGQRFGKLTVLRYSHTTPTGGAYWNCVCDCGNFTEARGRALKVGHKKSCGCLVKLDPYKSLYNFFCKTAKYRGIENELTFEDFIEYTKIGICHYCEAPIMWTDYNINRNSGAYNLDRKDNSIGYNKDNCVVCCERCNKGKGNGFSYDEWYKMTQIFRGMYHYEED